MRLSAQLKHYLLNAARDVIGQRLGLGETSEKSAPPVSSVLQEPGASFVTLSINHRLRGCIGTLEAHRPLLEDIHQNAIAAGFRDPRFPPLSAEEFPAVAIEISILSAHDPLSFTDEMDLIRQLRPGIDGLVIRQGLSRATFLPSVWQSLADPEEFLRHLKIKAGISTANRLEAWRYTTESFSSEDDE